MRLQLRTLVEALAVEHEVCVVALRWPDQGNDQGNELEGVELMALDAPAPGLAERARDRAAALVLRRPVDWARLSRPFADVLPALVSTRHFDVAHVALDDLAPVAPLLAGVPAVVAPLDARHRNIRAQRADATGGARLWRAQQERSVRRALGPALRPYRAAVFVTDDDARAVQRLAPSLRTVVIPLAVDAGAFARPATEPPRDPELIVLTGALSAPATADAARRLAECILPLVRRRVPDARLALVGRRSPASVRALVALPGVEVVADPPDLRPWLWRAGAVACPRSHGTGMKNTVLEAMASGAATVATAVACRGLDVRPGDQLLQAESDEDLAAALVDVLSDPALRQRLGDAAHAHVVAHHSPAVIAARYTELYEDVVASASS